MKNRKTKGLLLSMLCFVLFGVMNLQVQAATVYTEGYLHYVIEDNAIAITEYFGSETEVTVPSVIAGYPVDTIKKGAFANASTVEKVNLPDTIMTVEQGAMKEGQTLIYASNTEDPITSGGQESNTENTQNPTTDDKDQTEGSSTQNPAGVEEAEVDLSKPDGEAAITDGADHKISVDVKNHLIQTSPDGTVTVLDDQNTYQSETKPDGSTRIIDESGEEVTVDDDGNVVIPSQKDESAEKGSTKIIVGIAIGIAVIIIIVFGVLIYRRKHII
ncbi:MAG: hypothetical protein PHG16_08075 [Lachnospiraceae bacterium]|nr:hypothetical protein [Lachnospiraceae bacterium]